MRIVKILYLLRKEELKKECERLKKKSVRVGRVERGVMEETWGVFRLSY